MKSYFLVLTILLSYLLNACNSSESGSKKIDSKTQQLQRDFEDRIASIENNTELTVSNSLAYNNNAGSKTEVSAYMSGNEEVMKIEESFMDAESGNYGKYIFYIDKGKKFASKEVYFDNTLKSPAFVERVSYYDTKGKPVYTGERTSVFEQDLEHVSFKPIVPADLSIDRTMRIINQEGEFETTFQGFVENGGMTYLLVGENKPDGFTAALVVQQFTKVINMLKSDEKKFIGLPLAVSHESVLDESGLKFRILIDVQVADQ